MEGEAGIGESARLAWTVQRASAAGMLVLSARAGELEQDFGYGVPEQIAGRLRRRFPEDAEMWVSTERSTSRCTCNRQARCAAS